MIIKAIELQNWRCHAKTKLEFAKGTNVIIGRIGAGKTSVLNAISYALFGTFPELQRKQVSVQQIIAERPFKSDFAKVILEFEHAGKNYKIERIINAAKSNEAKLYEENKLLAGPKVSDVNARIVQLLGFDYELFSRAIYAEQNNIDYLLKLSPAERKAKMDQLLGLERYEIARKNAVTLMNSLKGILSAKKQMLEELKKSFSEEAIKKLAEEINEISKKMKEIEEKSAKHKIKLQEISEELKKLEESKRRVEDLKYKENQLKGKIETIKQRMESLQSELELAKLPAESEASKLIENAERELANAERELKKLNERKATFEATKAKIEELRESTERIQRKLPKEAKKPELIEAKIREVEAKIASAKELASKLEDEILAHRKEIEELQKLIGLEEQKIVQESERIKKLEKASICPLCKSKLSEKHRRELIEESSKAIANAKAEIENKRNAIEALNRAIFECKEKIEKARKEESELMQIKAHFAALKEDAKQLIENEKRIAMLEKELEKVAYSDAELEKAEQNVESARKNLERVKKIDELVKTKRMLDELERELISLQKELSSISFDETAYKNALSDFERTKNELISFEKEKSALEELLKEKNNRFNELKDKRELMSKLSRETEKLAKICDKLLIFINSLKATQVELRETLIEAINEALAELWEKVYAYEDYEALKLFVSDTGYELKVKRFGRWYAIEGLLSGGERSLAALVLRIASSFVLAPQAGLLILDEPTHNLDTKSIGKLNILLREVLPGLLEQIFVITHERELANGANASIYLLSREANEATKVELIPAR